MDDFQAILERIREDDPTLKLLDLGDKNIGDSEAQALAEALKVNTNLKNINLGNNNIQDAGAQALAGALKVNATLKNLHLTQNEIGDAGAQDLALALTKNKTLTTLDLGNNRIQDAGIQAIEKALEVNITLTSLAQWNEQGSQDLKDKLKRNRDLPEKIAEKIYQSLIQKRKDRDQDQTAPSEPVSLDPIEKWLITVSPNACIKILQRLLAKKDISEIEPKELFEHIKQFPGGLGLSGLKILISSKEDDDLKNFFKLDTSLTLNDVILSLGVAKEIKEDTTKGTRLGSLNDDLLREIIKYEDRPNSPQPTIKVDQVSPELSKDPLSSVR